MQLFLQILVKFYYNFAFVFKIYAKNKFQASTARMVLLKYLKI